MSAFTVDITNIKFMNTKQIIVVRNDLKMPVGKLASQVAHASMAFLTRNGDVRGDPFCPLDYEFYTPVYGEHMKEISHWLANSFRKIVCYVNSEEELRTLHEKALEEGLVSHMIEDNGMTVFKGVKTLTAISIGPHWDNEFENITDHLPLL